ncbi:ABC transporter permease [Emticicia aquatilis]|uniref:ABC transporter permease n=1 Tax=Emticicia aquatilis TaxID=1537369 RepID=A0A917DS13_9BACT|nr:FtsX-like permease family protein [Emticicia aquatilis]GGD61170.1 ABC transporter permease [Emticicia aquatilis]
MLKNYLKIAFRNLTKNKVYTLINVLGLSLGIFGSLVIFQLIKFHLLTDSHHHKAENIYRVVMNLHLDDGSVEHEKGSPYILHEALKNDFSSIENVAYLGQQELTLSIPTQNGSSTKFLEKEAAAFIGADYFKVFDYQWLIGQSAALNTPNTVILTEKYAKKYFGEVNPINKVLIINNTTPVKVAGILKDIPETTDLKTEVFVSLPTLKTIVNDDSFTEWAWFMKQRETYIRLKENTAKAAFEAQLPAFSKKYYGEMSKYYRFQLQELSDVHFDLDFGGKISKSNIYLFSAIGILLLVVACINFINLSTAQSFKRFKEIGVRKTLGSSQTQIIWQFIVEVSLITLWAVFFAVIFAYLATPLVNNWLNINITFRQFFDTQMLFFLPILIIFTIIVAGLYPSLVVSGYNPIHVLKGISKSSKTGLSLRKGLVVSQFSVAIVLVAVAILVVWQIRFLHNKDIGSTKDLIIHVQVPNTENLETLRNQITQKPFVESVSFARRAPSAEKGGSGGTIKFKNRDWEKFVARSKIADENYLNTYQIKLLTGRKPVASDTIREILVNRKLVKDLGLKTPESILNKRLLVGDANGTGVIVGVVADFNNADLYTPIEPTVIFSLKQRYRFAAIRLNKYSSEVLAELKGIWSGIYPNEVFEYSFYDDELAKLYKREEITRNIIISFALLTIFISCLGLMGLVNLTVSQRTKEIGIRKVLGASVSSITFLLSKDFLKLVFVAIIIASPIAYYFMNQWLNSFAFKVEIEWWVFVLSGVFIVAIALLTVSYQSIKAALMNPVKSLKTE